MPASRPLENRAAAGAGVHTATGARRFAAEPILGPVTEVGPRAWSAGLRWLLGPYFAMPSTGTFSPGLTREKSPTCCVCAVAQLEADDQCSADQDWTDGPGISAGAAPSFYEKEILA